MFPTPFTVLTHAVSEGADDAYGSPTKTWAAGVQQRVMGWAPASTDREPVEVGRTVVVRDLDVFAPPEFAIGPHDRATIDGLLYEVVGNPGDYTHGPFGFTPGIVVSLKRVEG